MTDLYSIGYQHGISGRSLISCQLRHLPEVCKGFTAGKNICREANATANFPVPDSDRMGAPKRVGREQR